MTIKKIFVVLSTLFACVNSLQAVNECDCVSHALPNSQYSRTIVFSQNLPWTNANPTDPNHSIALNLVNASGAHLYTLDQLNAITSAAILEFNNAYGIDFGAVTPDANGIRFIPGVGAFLPFILGADKNIPLINDSAHPNRGPTHKWYYVIVGNLVLFGSTPVSITSGINTGAIVPPNSLWSSGELNMLKDNSDKREIIKLTTTYVGLQSTDQWGNRSFNFVMDIFDEDGDQGLFQSTTTVVKEPAGTGPYILKEYPVLTWPCTNCSE